MEYKVESTELTDIADAIREKSGSQDALTFPDEFVSGIMGIPTGSTSIVADEYDDQSTYDVGDYVVYEDALYKCNTAITTAEAWTSAHWDEVTVMEEVETKADTDGMYEDMSVGNLISTQFVENKEPYLFRRTGNGKNIDGSEKAFIDKIIGGTVAWNQKAKIFNATNWGTDAGATVSYSDGTAIITSTTARDGLYYLTQNDYVIGHKYYLHCEFKCETSVLVNYGSGATFGVYIQKSIGSNWTSYDIIQTCINNTNPKLYIFPQTIVSGLLARNPILIDLTSLFGSAEIADYVYSLEQTTAGAGVAWLKSHGFLTKDYYAYNEGSLLSVKTSAHVMRDENDAVIATYPLDSDLELRGIPKLSNGNLYYDGDEYESSGAVTRKYGYRAYQSGDESLTDAITDGTNTVYKLTTPTTEQADPYANPQVVSPYGTEEYVDTRDVPVPVGHETRYMANLREKIEDLPWDLSMIAPIENGATASRAYSTGQYFLKDNQFCKALTSIASGATFTLNTNYAVTTVADELYSALHS